MEQKVSWRGRREDRAVVPWRKSRFNPENAGHQLDFDSPRAPDPPGFRGKLTLPQRAMLWAMLDFEARPCVRSSVVAAKDARNLGDIWLTGSTAVMCGKFGLGKTVVTVALLCAAPAPGALCRASVLGARLEAKAWGDRTNPGNEIRDLAGEADGPVGLQAGVMRVRPRAGLEAALVVAASGVISQWEDNIRRFAPHLRSFVVSDAYSIRDFEAMLRSGAAGELDVVLLKAGTAVTGAFGFMPPGEQAKGTRSFMYVFCRLVEGICWSRLIIDDYDTVILGLGEPLPEARVTWLVSATRNRRHVPRFREKRARAPVRPPPFDFGAGAPADKTRAAPGGEGPGERTLFGPVLAAHGAPRAFGLLCRDETLAHFTVRCAESFVRDHHCLPPPVYRGYVVDRGNIGRALELFGVPPEIVELLNAGAYDAAAERLGRPCETPGDLLRSVLRDNYEDYAAAGRAEQRLGELLAALEARGPPASTKAAALRAFRLVFGARPVPEIFDECGLRGPGPATAEAEAWARERIAADRAEAVKVLERFRGNFEEEECQVCRAFFEEIVGRVCIVPCCQIVLCSRCLAGVLGGQNTGCPNCRHPVNHQELVIVPASLDALSEPEPAEPSSPCETGPAGPEQEKGDAPAPLDVPPGRCRALLQLLRGERVERIEDWDPPAIDGLLDGGPPLPPFSPRMGGRKILVFCAHRQAVERVRETLEQHGVVCRAFGGTRRQKDAGVAWYREPGERILLVNSNQDCAGLHLPETTHLIFYHRHRNRSVEAQVVGRAQRMGRECVLEVHYLVDFNEARW